METTTMTTTAMSARSIIGHDMLKEADKALELLRLSSKNLKLEIAEAANSTASEETPPKKWRSVHFNEEISVCNYERVEATEIYKLYYQEHDYRRFREEKLLAEIREAAKAAAAREADEIKPRRPRRRRDSMTMNRGNISHREAGAAQAA